MGGKYEENSNGVIELGVNYPVLKDEKNSFFLHQCVDGFIAFFTGTGKDLERLERVYPCIKLAFGKRLKKGKI